MTRTTVIIGPPGCGKTTEVGRRVAEKVGAGVPALVCSLTRAAAAEIVGRDLPIAKNCIGTLHAHAYAALGRPKVTESELRDWNESEPEYAVSGGFTDPDDPMAPSHTQASEGDKLTGAYHLSRARMIPRKLWNNDLHEFAVRWEQWKEANALIDFSDMIERATRCAPPGDPRIIFADECQDHSRLELELLRSWSRNLDDLVIVGDPYQALYTWRGAYPEMFQAGKLPADHRHVLGQSYRVPRAVHAAAMEWIGRLSNFEEIHYLPRDDDGVAAKLFGAGVNSPEVAIEFAQQKLDEGASVMICASCGYHLRPTLAVLRNRGIPFSNPWRRKRGDWNPLSVTRGTSMSQRLLAFVKTLRGTNDDFQFGANVPQWSIGDLSAWASVLKASGTLVRGAKKVIEEAAKVESSLSSRPVSQGDIRNWFEGDCAEFLCRVADGSVPVDDAMMWYEDRIMDAKKRVAAFPFAVARLHGISALEKEPRLFIGTIHSFKGSQADVVIVFPDLAPAGFREWTSTQDDGRDSILRMYYVAITRARSEVHVCLPASSLTCDVMDFVK